MFVRRKATSNLASDLPILINGVDATESFDDIEIALCDSESVLGKAELEKLKKRGDRSVLVSGSFRAEPHLSLLHAREKFDTGVISGVSIVASSKTALFQVKSGIILE